MQLHLDEQLSRLRLGGMKQALNQQQAQSMLYLDMGFEERLQLLLSHELVQREQENQPPGEASPVSASRTGGAAGLSGGPGVSKAQIRQLLEGHWLSHQQNLLLTGAAGCGKSYLACALGRYFIRQGVGVRYYRLKTLLEEMRLAQADGSYPKLLEQVIT